MLLFLLAFAAQLCAQTAPLMLGVLEDSPGLSQGDAHHRAVRAVFYKDGPDWRPFPQNCITDPCLAKLATDFPSTATWTIAFDGRKLGTVETRIPPHIEFASDVGQQLLVSASALAPTIGKRTDEFAGFLGEPVFRPLVAVSQPNADDPDHWKPVLPSTAQKTALRAAFRKQFPKVQNCGDGDSFVEDWTYADSDFHFEKSYSSSTGWTLASLELTNDNCDGPPDPAFNIQWFTINPAGEVHYLAADRRLVDAGDYDHSGHSQLLFMIDAYNNGGYVLYYNDFQKSATFEYGFH